MKGPVKTKQSCLCFYGSDGSPMDHYVECVGSLGSNNRNNASIGKLVSFQ